jgi:hypothetical protein
VKQTKTKTICRDMYPLIDRDVTPAGWYRIVERAGSHYAIFNYGSQYRELGPFASSALASRASWGNTPECNDTGDRCPRHGKGA